MTPIRLRLSFKVATCGQLQKERKREERARGGNQSMWQAERERERVNCEAFRLVAALGHLCFGAKHMLDQFIVIEWFGMACGPRRRVS